MMMMTESDDNDDTIFCNANAPVIIQCLILKSTSSSLRLIRGVDDDDDLVAVAVAVAAVLVILVA